MWKLKPWIDTLASVVRTASLVLAALGTAILLFIDIPALRDVPDSVVVIILAVAIALILISDKLAADKHKLEIARMQALLDEKRNLQHRLNHLATLRNRAVNELYAGTPSAAEFAMYERRYLAWQEEVEAYLKANFPYAIVEAFADLGMIKTLSFKHASTDPTIAESHTHILQMLAKQLTILEKWIEQKGSLTLDTEPTEGELLTRVRQQPSG